MSDKDLDAIINGGPGEYNDVKYEYNGQTYYFNIKVGTIDQGAGVNVNGYGSGITGDAAVYDKYLSDHTNNSIDVRFAFGHNAYTSKYDWKNAISSLVTDLDNAFGLDKNKTTLSGFSMTAHGTIDFAATYAKKTGATGFTAVVMEDVSGAKISEETRKSLVDHDVTIINAYAAQSSKNSVWRNKDTLQSYNGVHMIDIKFTASGGVNPHVVPHDILASNGITNLGNGTFDFTQLPTEVTARNGRTKYTVKYEFTEHYVNEKGEYVSRTITADEANKVLQTGPYYSGIIQSDNEYLQQYLTNINLKLTALENSVFKLNVTSTTAIPASEVKLLNALTNAIKQLCQKMHDEMVMFGKIGNRLSDLDIELDADTTKLMQDFRGDLSAQPLDIPVNDIVNSSYDLDQLIEDYNQFVKDFRASIPEHSPEIMRDKDMKDPLYTPTADELNALFEHWAETTGNKDNKYLGMGAAFLAAAEATGIDPLTLIGVSAKETGYGGTGVPGNVIDDNNFFGLDGDTKYETPEEGIMAGAQKLKEDYENGVTSVGKIGVDPTAENPDTSYGDDVGSIMDESLNYIVDTTAQPIEEPAAEEPPITSNPKTDPGSKNPKPSSPGNNNNPSNPDNKPQDNNPDTNNPDNNNPGDNNTGDNNNPGDNPGDNGTGDKPDDNNPGENTGDTGTGDNPDDNNPDTGVDDIVEPEPEPDPEPDDSNNDGKPKKPKRPDPIPDPDKPKKPSPIPTPDPSDDNPGEEQGSNIIIDLDDNPDEPGIVVDPDQPENPDDSGIIIEPTPDDEPIDEPEPEPEPTPEPESKDEGGGSVLRTIGVMTAVGAGVGAAAYAAHRVIEKNNSEDDHYSYESNKEEKEESLGDQYKEYYSDDNMNAFGGDQ